MTVESAVDPSWPLECMAALVPGGLAAVPREILSALKRDDIATAFRAANARYARTSGHNHVDAIVYATLLLYRELPDEALGVLRRALSYREGDIALQILQIEALLLAMKEEAHELLDAVSNVSITDHRHWAHLGGLFEEIGDNEQALKAYEQALDHGSEDADVCGYVARLHAAAGRYWDAAELFERAARMAPSDPVPWARATDAWIEVGAWDRATHTARRTARLAPDEPGAWALLGTTHREAGELGEALVAFEKARNLDPDNAVHHLNLGALQLELGLAAEARRSYQHAAAIDADGVEAINGMVAAAYDLGDVEQAIKMARRAVELEPDHPDSLYNLGVIALSMHDAQTAHDAFLDVITVDPDNAQARAGRATALLLMGDLDAAIAAAQDAVRHDATDAELVLEFTQFLFRHGGANEVLTFLSGVGCNDPAWKVVVPVFEYVAHALNADGDGQTTAFERFRDRGAQHVDALPVTWDFDELERIGFALDEPIRDRLMHMLAVLEGRRSMESFPATDDSSEIS